MNRRNPHAVDRARRDSDLNRLDDREWHEIPGITFECGLCAVVMPANVNCGDVDAVVRRRLFMAAVM